ncbi:MAG: HAD-IA family hydrolase [Candidatus Pacebacteria bacterium]|nr:HAD-IA family hydrolase [Candidatus Paceibacterota bacterium]MCF7862859.1 HAD-IA family hydrolase [Candidatus Paceibacterota bacterium]
MKVKAIVFDYGGVIEKEEGDVIQEIATYLKTTRKDWERVYFSVNHLANSGKNTMNEVMALVAREFNATDEQISNIYKMLEESKKTKRLNLELVKIIKDLKKNNYKIGLVSNYSKSLRNKLSEQDIYHLFDEIIISEEVGYQKPQPEIFDIISKKLGVNNNEMIFVDDTERSLEGAENIGYVPILYRNNNQLLEDLLKHQILNIKI